MTNEELIDSLVSTEWSVYSMPEHDRRDTWTELMAKIQGACSMCILGGDYYDNELLDELDFLWNIALKRRTLT